MMGLPNLTFSNVWDSEATKVSEYALIPLTALRPSGPFNRSRFVENRGPEKLSSNEGESDLGPLFEAARQRRRSGTTGRSSDAVDKSEDEEEEYWTPKEPIGCPLPIFDKETSSSKSEFDDYIFVGQWTRRAHRFQGHVHQGLRHAMSAVPIVFSVSAAVLVGMNGGGDVAMSETSFVNNGPLPTNVISGVELQLLLTSIVWYMIGAVFCEVAVFMTTAFVTIRDKKN
jgi:hypothetical protein